MKTEETITDRAVDPDILAYTVGDDPVLDRNLRTWDCMGTTAHGSKRVLRWSNDEGA